VLRSALVVGLDSQIGAALVRTLRARGVHVRGTRHSDVPGQPDATQLDLAVSLDDWQPARVECGFLCAGLTSVAACERNPRLSHRVNVDAQVEVAKRLTESGAHVVFLSTNMVFDGSKPLRQADEPTCPTTVYGAHKAEAEQQLQQLGDRVTVLRLTKVLTREHPLLHDWKTALQRGEAIHPFSDVVLAPVAMDQVVEALSRLADEPSGGIFQLSGDRDVSYAQVALALGHDPHLVQPISGAYQYPTQPPMHTTLDVSGLRQRGMHVRATQQTLEAVCR